jgi:putative ABC transport system permease protein
MPDWRAYVRDHLPLPKINRRRAERIVQELASQLQEIYEEALARGAREAEAEQEVERHAGDWDNLALQMTRAERRHRDPATRRWLDRVEDAVRARGAVGRLASDFVKDARYAVRGLRRSPGFTATVVVVLALGIAAATAMFTVVDTLLLKPLPYPDPDRLVTVWTTYARESRTTTPLSGPNFVDLRDRTTSFDELGVQTMSWVNLSAEGRAERVRASECTAGFLRALGAAPAMGRVFTDREVEDGRRVAVLSAGSWQKRFGGDPDIVGRTITVNGDPYTVVGVMPRGFTSPRLWYTSQGAALWLPVAVTGEHKTRDVNWLFGLGRLAPGVTREAAEAELESVAAALATEYPEINTDKSFWILPLSQRMVQRVKEPLIFLVAGAALLLLIAATNAASIVFARATTRQPLAAIRASLGASRARLVRQVVTESLVLSSVGGLLGLLLAWAGMGGMRRAIPTTVERAGEITLSGSACLCALAATIGIGVLIGLAVGLAHSQGGGVSLVRESLRSATGGRRRVRLHGLTVAVQFALTLLLADATALMLRSYLNAAGTPVSFNTERTVTAGITLQGDAYREEAVQRTYWDGLLERVSALPGVEAAGLTSKLPLNGGSNGWVLVGTEEFDPRADRPLVEYSFSTAGYFSAMGLDVLEGRTFRPGDDDTGGLGLVVNRTFAERFFPGESALGRAVRANSSQPGWSGRIVGVVEDVPQWGLERNVLPEIYFPFSIETITSPWLVVATDGAPAVLMPALRRAVASLDPNVPIASVRTMAEVVSDDIRPRRVMTFVIGVFAAVGLILVGTGLYGVVAYQVASRRHEIGIRMAIGAERCTVVRMVLGQGLRLAGLGTAVGLVAALATSRWVSGLLFGVTPIDPLSFALVIVALGLVAALGTAVPALRAAAVNPVETLRAE